MNESHAKRQYMSTLIPTLMLCALTTAGSGQEVPKQINGAGGGGAASATTTEIQKRPVPEAPKLKGPALRQLESLMLIVEEGEKAKTDEDRKRLLLEFLEESAPFLKENPRQLSVWSLRATAALQLNYAKTAWEAGQQMIKLHADSSEEAKVRKALAMLNGRGLLTKEPTGFWSDPYVDAQIEDLCAGGLPVPTEEIFKKARTEAIEALRAHPVDLYIEQCKWALLSHTHGGWPYRSALLFAPEIGSKALFQDIHRRARQSGDPVLYYCLICPAIFESNEKVLTEIEGVLQKQPNAFLYKRMQRVVEMAKMQLMVSRMKTAEKAKNLREAAESGAAEAQFELGRHYLDGSLGLKKDGIEAIKWLKRAASAGHVEAQERAAWMLATSPDANVRNAKDAIALAMKACEIREWKDARMLDTLAAAFAEGGNFEQAVKYSKLAIQNADSESVGELKNHLGLFFEKGRPYRDNTDTDK